MKRIDMNKKYKTRDGRDVRILCIDARHKKYPVVGLINNCGFEEPKFFTKNGHYYTGGDSDSDLIEVKEKKSGWINIYPGAHVTYEGVYPKYCDAVVSRNIGCVATIKIEWED